jgi:hypothetical protein
MKAADHLVPDLHRLLKIIKPPAKMGLLVDHHPDEELVTAGIVRDATRAGAVVALDLPVLRVLVPVSFS